MDNSRITEIFETDLSDDGGVLKEIITEGTGEKPTTGHEVDVHYVGTLLDGTEFDSSRKRESPFSFQLGAAQVIKGWEVGVASMKKGERCNLTLKPDYAYGAGGSGKIPPNATLKFDVELLDFRAKSKDKWAMTDEEKIEAAQELKERGNEQLKSGNYSEAEKLYTEALEYCETDELKDSILPQAETLQMSCHLNLSNCYFKMKRWADSVQRASLALMIDGNSVKAFYRRGIANLEWQMLDQAKYDLNKAAHLDPKNVEVRKELARCKKVIAANKHREGALFKEMFGKIGGIYNDKEGIPEARNYKGLPQVFMDVKIGSEEPKRIKIVLYDDTVPRTAENFRQICTGEAGTLEDGKPHHFKGSIFHRIIKGFMAQGGDITNADGTGGKSIYGEKFDDEKFVDTHTTRGKLSMANSGPNTNGSQFFITFGPAEHLDGKHVVFGEVLEESMAVLDEMENAPLDGEKPVEAITIVDSGELEKHD